MQYKALLALPLVAVLSGAQAQIDKRQISIGGSAVPSCPGVLTIGASVTQCCVGGDLTIATPNLSSCAGWPMCTGPVTVSSSSRSQSSSLSCAALLNVNDANYSSRLASVTSAIAAGSTPASTAANPTGAASTSGSSASRSSSGSAAASSTSAAAASGASKRDTPSSVFGVVLLAGAVGTVGWLL